MNELNKFIVKKGLEIKLRRKNQTKKPKQNKQKNHLYR